MRPADDVGSDVCPAHQAGHGQGQDDVGEHEHVQWGLGGSVDAASASDALDDLGVGDGGAEHFEGGIVVDADVEGSACAVRHQDAACFDVSGLGLDGFACECARHGQEFRPVAMVVR